MRPDVSHSQEDRHRVARPEHLPENMSRVQTVRSGQPVPVKPSGRVATARRVQAARLMAGDPSLRQLASATGMSYRHLIGVVNATEPLLDSDARDLAAALRCPEAWLRHGWADDGE